MTEFSTRASDVAAVRSVASVLIAAASPADRDEACRAAAVAGLRVARAVPIDELADALAVQVHVDVLLVELAGLHGAALDTALAHISDHAPAQCRTILCLAADQIDPVSALAGDSGAELLCDASLADRVGALALAAGRTGMRLSDAARDSEQARLRRLDEEVARIAQVLASLSGGRDRTGETLHERALGYAPPPAMHDGGAAAQVRAAIRARRLRDRFFDPTLFADPAWDMLLDLYAARLEHARVSVSSLCIAAAVPPTTALRWIATMTDAGLLGREADPMDRRRAFVTLSDEAAGGMRDYFAEAARAGLASA